MDRIWKDLSDPNWWFTAFFIAIIASLIAAYAKDVINALLSIASKRYKGWYEKLRERERKEIEQMANNPISWNPKKLGATAAQLTLTIGKL